MTVECISLRDVQIAQERILASSRKTPILGDAQLGEKYGATVTLKLENLQLTNSFKIRGAANKILSMSTQDKARGVITVSSGNHGRAVAYIAQQSNIVANICVPETVPKNKIDAIRNLGGNLIIEGKTYDEANLNAIDIQSRSGATFVPAFDDPMIIAGQGTIGLELIEQMPSLDTIVVPLSGGGLIAGIAFTLKSNQPTTRIIGVSMERGPAMIQSLKAGRVVEIQESPTLADALMGGLGDTNEYTLQMCQRYVDETVLVSEEEIAHAMYYAFKNHRVVVEGGGAVGLGAMLAGKIAARGKHIAIVVSGGNVDIPTFVKVIKEQDADA